MAKTYEVVVYDDDGAGVTSSVTEYDRDDNGVQTYVGRAWLDVDDTALVVAVVSGEGRVVRRAEEMYRDMTGATTPLHSAAMAEVDRQWWYRLARISLEQGR